MEEKVGSADIGSADSCKGVVLSKHHPDFNSWIDWYAKQAQLFDNLDEWKKSKMLVIKTGHIVQFEKSDMRLLGLPHNKIMVDTACYQQDKDNKATWGEVTFHYVQDEQDTAQKATIILASYLPASDTIGIMLKIQGGDRNDMMRTYKIIPETVTCEYQPSYQNTEKPRSDQEAYEQYQRSVEVVIRLMKGIFLEKRADIFM